MKIAINCRCFSKKQYTGIGRYAYHLIHSLSEIDQANQYSLYVPRRPFDFKRRDPVVKARNFHLEVDHFNRGLNRTLHPVDVYHTPCIGDVAIDNAKVVVTIHDLIYKAYPQGHTPATIDLTDQLVKAIIQKADRIICSSQNTINDLNRFFRVDPAKVRLVYLGVDQNIFYPVPAEEIPQAREVIRSKGIVLPYIFFVGTIEPRKNLINLLKALAILREQKKFDGPLVISGMKGWLNEDLAGVIERLDLKKRVVFLGFLTDTELRYFYSQAEVFAFPSLYEGFGLPIVEAFSCGTPVVTSNVSSCAELAHEAALAVDPTSPQAIADAIAKIIASPQLRKELIQKGLERAKFFSFRKTAQETLKIYQEFSQ